MKRRIWFPKISWGVIIWQIFNCAQEPTKECIYLTTISAGIVLLSNLIANSEWVDAGGKKMTYQVSKFVFGLLFLIGFSVFCQFKPISFKMAIRLLASLYCIPLLFCFGLGYLYQWATRWKNGKPTQIKVADLILRLID